MLWPVCVHVWLSTLIYVERDTGFETDERAMLDHLKLMISGDYIGDSDFESDDDDNGLSMLAYMMWVMLHNASVD